MTTTWNAAAQQRPNLTQIHLYDFDNQAPAPGEDIVPVIRLYHTNSQGDITNEFRYSGAKVPAVLTAIENCSSLYVNVTNSKIYGPIYRYDERKGATKQARACATAVAAANQFPTTL